MENPKIENNEPRVRSFVSKETIEIAVEVVLKWINSKAKEEKSQPAEHDRPICLYITMEKIPDTLKKISHVPVSHPLFPFDGSQKACLIIGEGKEGLNLEVAENKIKAESLPISKVFEYKTVGDKIKLACSFDLFMADKTVFSQVPSLLEPTFFSRKRSLIPVDLTHEQWRGQMEAACTSAAVSIRGSCCIVNAAMASQTSKEIVENVVAVIRAVLSAVPKKGRRNNIGFMYLKSLDTLAFPLYYSSPIVLGIEGLKRRLKTPKPEKNGAEGVTEGLSSKKRTADEERAPGAKRKKGSSSNGSEIATEKKKSKSFKKKSRKSKKKPVSAE